MTTAPSVEPNNQDLLVWALYQLGGASTLVDVEEIFVKCFELAPARLGWRTRPDLPDYKKCSKALQSVEASTHPGLLMKRSRYLRKLTREGVEWCERHAAVLSRVYGGENVAAPSTREDQRTLRELRQHPVFDLWLEGRELPDGMWDLADALRCSVASPDAIWEARLDELARLAAGTGDTEVGEFIDAVRVRRQGES